MQAFGMHNLAPHLYHIMKKVFLAFLLFYPNVTPMSSCRVEGSGCFGLNYNNERLFLAVVFSLGKIIKNHYFNFTTGFILALE